MPEETTLARPAANGKYSAEALLLVQLQVEFAKLRQALSALERDELDVRNLDEVRGGVRKELDRLVDKFDIKFGRVVEAMQRFKYEVQLPDKVNLTGIDSLVATLEDVARLLSEKDFAPVVDVRIPEIKLPDIRVPDIHVPAAIVPHIDVPDVHVDVDLEPLLEALKPLGFISNRAGKPISVRLSDGAKFIQAMKETAKQTERAIQVLSQGGGMTLDDFKTVAGVPRTFGHLKVSVPNAGTPVNVSTSSVPCLEAYLAADTDAGASVVVGGSNAVRATAGNKNGLLLVPGNTPMVVKTNDLKNLWVDAETNGGVLCVGYAVL